MTFEEIDQKLPNGFHDAKIRTVKVDFVGRSIVIDMNLWVGSLDGPDPERRRSGTLKVASAYLFFIEPPDPTYNFVPDGSPLNVSGDSVTAGQSTVLDHLLPVLPRNATLYRFFLEEWNSFVYLAGADVEFSWEEEG